MAVLVEGLSVVIPVDVVRERYPGGWAAFDAAAPNQTLCADDELARIGFMSPEDVATFVAALRAHGIVYEQDGKARDLVVIDQIRGPLLPCDWVELGDVTLAPSKRIAACRKKGSAIEQIVTPPGWSYETSLSATYTYVPKEHLDKSFKFLRHEDGFDVYRNELTGAEAYVGRTAKG